MLKDIVFPKKCFLSGSVVIAGAGPGNPDLLTLKVFYSIKYADVIIYDGLVNKNIINFASKTAKLIFAGKSSLNKSCTQEDINKWMVFYAKKNKKVLRLKSGDPSVFGRGAEEIEFLKINKIPFKIYSGITASQEALNILKKENIINNEFCIITGHKAINSNTPQLDYKSLSKSSKRIIIYMGLSQLNFVAKKLIENGKKKETKVEIVKDISLRSQKKIITNLEDCLNNNEKFGLKPPVIIIIN